MDRAMETFHQLSTPQAIGVVTLPLAAGYMLMSYYQKPRAYAPGGQPIPRPKGALPFLGSTVLVARNSHRFVDWLAEVCEDKEGKPWLLEILGRRPLLVVSSPSVLEDIFKTQNDLFIKDPHVLYLVSDLFGYGIVNSNGNHWAYQRKTASHLFSMQMMKDVMHTTIRTRTQEFLRVLHEHSNRKTVVSGRTLFTELTTDVFTQVGFGIDMKSMQKGLRGETNDFIESIRILSVNCIHRSHLPDWLWRLRRMLRIGEEEHVAKSKKYLDDLIYKIVRTSIDQKEQEILDGRVASSDSRSKDLITLILDSQAKEASTPGSSQVDMTLVRDMALNFFLAGAMTTSSTLSWILLELNRHPDVLAKIRAEMKAKLPHLLDANADVPTVEEATQLSYLEAVIRETMRLDTTVPLTHRYASSSTTLSDGTYVGKGMGIQVTMHAPGILHSVWGEDARVYRPERWIDPSTGGIISLTETKFPVFGAGPRRCIGQRMAMVELQIVMCALLCKFDLKLMEDPYTIGSIVGVELNIDSELPVKVVPYQA